MITFPFLLSFLPELIIVSLFICLDFRCWLLIFHQTYLQKYEYPLNMVKHSLWSLSFSLLLETYFYKTSILLLNLAWLFSKSVALLLSWISSYRHFGDSVHLSPVLELSFPDSCLFSFLSLLPPCGIIYPLTVSWVRLQGKYHFWELWCLTISLFNTCTWLIIWHDIEF